MLSTLDWIVIVGFLAIILAVGLSFTGRAGRDLTSYFLGGRKLPWYIAGISMVATTFAADTPLAVTELVAQNGISGNWLWWNMLAGGLLTTFFFAKLWRRSGVLTELEFIELRYSGKPAAFLRGLKAVYLGFFINVLIIGWVNLALIALLQGFFDLTHTEAIFYCALAMGMVAVYASLSGLLGVVMTDAIQFVVAMAGCIILAILVVNSEKIGGLQGLMEQTPESARNFFPNISAEAGGLQQLAIGWGAFLAYAGCIWWASWYPGAEPGGGGYVAQRMMSAKNEKHSFFATLFFQVAHYCIRPWPWILVGLCALVLYPDITDKKLGFVYAMRDFLPSGLRGLLLVAFFAAYMSTISTQLNWGASYLTNDLYKRFMRPRAGDKHLVAAARVSTLLLMVAGLIASFLMDSISGVWAFIIECGAGLGLVLILRWYWWRINAWSEIAATLTPFIAFGVSKWVFHLEFPESFFLTIGCTTLSWLIVTFITSPTRKETLVSFFERIRPQGVWGPVANLSSQKIESRSILPLVVCWLSSIVFTYSILFIIGKILFAEWMSVLWLALAMLLSGVILILNIDKAILKDSE